MFRLLFSLAVLAALAHLPVTYGAVDKWTPAGFDWDSVHNATAIPSRQWAEPKGDPAMTTDLALLTDTEVGPVVDIAFLVFLGIAARVATLAVAAVELKNAIHSCKDAITKEGTVYDCVEALFLTAASFGAAKSGAKLLGKGAKRAGRLLFPHRFNRAEQVELALEEVYVRNGSKRRRLGRRGQLRSLSRDEALAQVDHDYEIRHHLSTLSRFGTEPELIRYADDDHHLALLPDKIHPLVPMFRFEHPTLGSMEMVAADTLNASHITLARAGHSTHLLGQDAIENLMKGDKHDKRDKYKDELFKKHALSARFDADASHADPHKLNANAGDYYNRLGKYIKCGIKSGHALEGHHAVDIQYFDKTHQTTFGFGMIGIYDNTQKSKSIDKLPVKGLPLQHCNKA